MKQWENKEPLPAVLTTWAFIAELPQKQKNQTHTEAAEMNILGLIGDITGILYCKQQILN